MPKRRSLDQKIRTSETFASLTYRQRDLWQGLIVCADDQGRLPGNPAYVRSVVWPYDDTPLSEVDADLDMLAVIGNIIRYQVEGKKYIQIINWHKYQSHAEWLGLSDHPAPDGWIDHARYHGTGNKIVTLNWEDRGATLKVGSGVGSGVGSALPCHDDDDDVNGDDDGDDDADDEQREPLAAAAEQLRAAGVNGKVNELLRLPWVTDQYVTDILADCRSKNKDSPGLIVKRIQDHDIPAPNLEDRSRYISGAYADLIQR